MARNSFENLRKERDRASISRCIPINAGRKNSSAIVTASRGNVRRSKKKTKVGVVSSSMQDLVTHLKDANSGGCSGKNQVQITGRSTNFATAGDRTNTTWKQGKGENSYKDFGIHADPHLLGSEKRKNNDNFEESDENSPVISPLVSKTTARVGWDETDSKQRAGDKVNGEMNMEQTNCYFEDGNSTAPDNSNALCRYRNDHVAGRLSQRRLVAQRFEEKHPQEENRVYMRALSFMNGPSPSERDLRRRKELEYRAQLQKQIEERKRKETFERREDNQGHKSTLRRIEKKNVTSPSLNSPKRKDGAISTVQSQDNDKVVEEGSGNDPEVHTADAGFSALLQRSRQYENEGIPELMVVDTTDDETHYMQNHPSSASTDGSSMTVSKEDFDELSVMYSNLLKERDEMRELVREQANRMKKLEDRNRTLQAGMRGGAKTRKQH